jgi:hypothetical protein
MASRRSRPRWGFDVLVTFYPRLMASREPAGRDLTWGALRATLSKFRPLSGGKDEVCKPHCPLWSPASLTFPRRLNVNVSEVSALVLDYDDGLDVDGAVARWEGYEAMGYTTWSHSPDAPRCRVVLPLARPIPGVWWSLIYRQILDGQGIEADRKCLDASRAFYLPAVGVGGPHRATSHDGERLDLYDEANDLHKSAEIELVNEKARRSQAARDLARRCANVEDRDKAAARLLDIDEQAREALAHRVGAVLLRDASGATIARRAPCPRCGRRELWWAIPRGWARCNHDGKSCGFAARLWDYAQEVSA